MKRRRSGPQKLFLQYYSTKLLKVTKSKGNFWCFWNWWVASWPKLGSFSLLMNQLNIFILSKIIKDSLSEQFMVKCPKIIQLNILIFWVLVTFVEFWWNLSISTDVKTIHLRRWQIFTNFWPLPPYRRQFFSTIRRQIWQTFDPSPQRHADVLNGWSLY